jgi:hypothetical protein
MKDISKKFFTPWFWIVVFIGYSVRFVKNSTSLNKVSLMFFIFGWLFWAIFLFYFINSGLETERKANSKNKKVRGVFLDYIPLKTNDLILFVGLCILTTFLGVLFNLI